MNATSSSQHAHPNNQVNEPPPNDSQTQHTPPLGDQIASSNPSLDNGTGIIRPNPDILMRMQDLGLKFAYAVAWKGGGGVFLFKHEAENSHMTAEATNSNPTAIRTFVEMSCNLTQIEALAVNWALQQKERLNGVSASPVRSPAASASSPSTGTSTQEQTTPSSSTPVTSSQLQAHSTQSPQQSTRTPLPPNTPQSGSPSAPTTQPPSHSVLSTTNPNTTIK